MELSELTTGILRPDIELVRGENLTGLLLMFLI